MGKRIFSLFILLFFMIGITPKSFLIVDISPIHATNIIKDIQFNKHNNANHDKQNVCFEHDKCTKNHACEQTCANLQLGILPSFIQTISIVYTANKTFLIYQLKSQILSLLTRPPIA